MIGYILYLSHKLNQTRKYIKRAIESSKSNTKAQKMFVLKLKLINIAVYGILFIFILLEKATFTLEFQIKNWTFKSWTDKLI